ncbi:zinc finger BED domain-containing protein RICESLEEPER 4-like [Lathyrus oleraceus]|uniref:zinc finger BED domain-containing protein RICESLEEPER 4-like n=1 Tax=Pisum sativum TaxID=3888 RepID=UPI0021D0A219|nr:zinc finger BED domain-containing protein RICESLEEPER 4-like [Pisum sativum]
MASLFAGHTIKNETIQGVNELRRIEDDVLPKSKKAKTSSADCWKVFTKLGADKDGNPLAKCNGCSKILKGGDRNYGTASLNRHMKKCTKIKYADVGQVMMDLQGRLKNLTIDKKVSRSMCATAIIAHDLPYKFVEFQKIRDWMKYLNPDFSPISRNTAKADVDEIFKTEKEALKKELANISSRISLTSDMWTTCTSEGYICLTAHYVDSNWNLKSKILNFCHMPPPHTGSEMSKKILDFLSYASLTLDNASANDVMQAHLKRQLVLQNWLLSKGEFFHVRCSAHVLNLIVQEGLKVIGDALEKIKESVKYVKGSEGRMKKFKECIELIGGIETSAGLSYDVSTRWNSTYLMLQSALKYRRVFASLSFHDDNYKVFHSEEDWKRGDKICTFLLPFYETTNLISRTSYPTFNLYFLQIWKIQCVLMASIKDEDTLIRDMAERMMIKFEKYWSDYSVVLTLGAVLDPRIKLTSLEYMYEKVDPLTSTVKTNEIKQKLYTLFEIYRRLHTSSSTTSQTPSSITRGKSSSHALTKKTCCQLLHAVKYYYNMLQIVKYVAVKCKKHDINCYMLLNVVITCYKLSNMLLLNDLKAHKQQLATEIGKSRLGVYLDEASVDLSYQNFDDLNVLQWWKENCNRFKELSLLARDLLGIHITTVASESAFSIGSIILNKYRSRLLSQNVEALICTRSWLHGFNSFDVVGDDEDNDDGSLTNSITTEASYVHDVDED